jgi:hypothetical protein
MQSKGRLRRQIELGWFFGFGFGIAFLPLFLGTPKERLTSSASLTRQAIFCTILILILIIKIDYRDAFLQVFSSRRCITHVAQSGVRTTVPNTN